MVSSKTDAQFFSFSKPEHQLRFPIPPLRNQKELDKKYSSSFLFSSHCSIEKYGLL